MIEPIDNPESRLASWPKRELWWRKKLGRIRLGVEPIAEQIERYRRATVLLSLVTSGIGAMLFALFLAFSKPIHGLVVAGMIVGPIVSAAWLDFWKLQARANEFIREREEIARLSNGKGA